VGAVTGATYQREMLLKWWVLTVSKYLGCDATVRLHGLAVWILKVAWRGLRESE